MNSEIKHLEVKIDTGFQEMNARFDQHDDKFDKHEHWEETLLDQHSEEIVDIKKDVYHLTKSVLDIEREFLQHKRDTAGHEKHISGLWLAMVCTGVILFWLIIRIILG